MGNIIQEFDTIAAISTPPGEGAISIIRLSGAEAVKISEQIFRQGELKLTSVASHTIHYGHIVNPKDNRVLDEVMVTVMRAPKTFTCEDVVEINTHGGTVGVNQVLQLVLRSGARLAEPGEFTKRAFLNGRIDLSQAEAVMDVIRAKTDQAMQVAINQLDGDLSTLIRSLRQDILSTLAQVEVNIDYPEYDDVEALTTQLLLEKTEAIKQSLDALLKSAKQGKILRDGLKTAIIGRPNVGKSSLLNHLLQEDKAIVTEIAGTTRDVIEELININGIPLKLIDTAGIRETEDIVEKIGVARSKKALVEAELILLVLNSSEALSAQDKLLLELTKDKKRIVLLNKTDLKQQLDVAELISLGVDEWLEVSILQKENLTAIEKGITHLFFEVGGLNEQDATYLSNTRHISLIEQAKSALDDVNLGIEQGMPVDLVQIDMTRCWDYLGEIVGDSIQDELITQLFSQFCLGK